MKTEDKCLECKTTMTKAGQAFCKPCMKKLYVTVCPICGKSIRENEKTILTSWDGIIGGLESHITCAAQCGAWRQKIGA